MKTNEISVPEGGERVFVIEFSGFMKILHIVGARPQFIKAVMVSRAWKGSGDEVILHTGQHYSDNMSRLFFTELELKEPDINLEVGSGTHAEQTSTMLLGIDRYLDDIQPDRMIIYGDTNSTLAGALAAAKRCIPLAHVEAGLRSFNRTMPEEINRIVSDHLADLHFCPTNQAVANLEQEGIKEHVFQVGDVMADALFHFVKIAIEKSTILNRVQVSPGRYGLVTIHRSGNVDILENLKGIIDGLAGIDIPLVFPVHPRTRKMLSEFNLQLPNHIKAIDPVGYLDMLALQENAEVILTDSGGIQKEAYLLGVRCITLREETEWVETVQSGWNTLVGTKSEAIRDAYIHFKPSGERQQFFGDGSAADKIIAAIKNFDQ